MIASVQKAALAAARRGSAGESGGSAASCPCCCTGVGLWPTASCNAAITSHHGQGNERVNSPDLVALSQT